MHVGKVMREVLDESGTTAEVELSPPHPQSPDSSCPALAGGALPGTRHPNSWAAYGRFLFASVRTRSSQFIATSGEDLHFFRRRVRGVDAGVVYAFQECASPETDIWITAVKALETLAGHSRVDQLDVYLAGSVPQEYAGDCTLHSVLGGAYLGMAMPFDTRDILELHDSFEEFLQSLGHSNRRHMKARFKEAIESGLKLEMSTDPLAPGMEQRFALAQASRPVPYPREQVEALDRLTHAQPGFFHAALFSPERELMSYCSGFLERDTAIVMYQFNHIDFPKLALSMTLRAFLIHHWAGTGIKRILFPVGINGHLTHATTTNPIAQVFLMRRSLAGLAKVLLEAVFVPTSDAARMVRSKGFVRRVLAG